MPESKLIFTFNKLMILCYLILCKKVLQTGRLLQWLLKNMDSHEAETTVSYASCCHWYYLLQHEEKYFSNKQYLTQNIEMEPAFLQYGYISIFQE